MKKKHPNIIIFILGLMVEVIAFFIKAEGITIKMFIYDMVVNVGFILLAIAIANAIWFLLGGDPMEERIDKSLDTLELAADGFRGGLSRAFLKSNSFKNADEWISLLKEAKYQVDMMGYSLYMLTCTKASQDVLRELANKNIKIRILIMDSENTHFSAGLNFDGLDAMTLETMKGAVDACTRCVAGAKKNVRENKKNNLKFATIKKGLTECQIIRIDNNIYVTPYLYSCHTADSPLFVFREQKNGYFEKYMEEFEKMWEQNKQ